MATLVRMASIRRSSKKRRCRRMVSFTKEVFVLDAIREGSLRQVEELFASDGDGDEEAMDVNAYLLGGKTPLHQAVLAMREDVVKLLLNQGAKPDLEDDSGYTPLHRAIETGDADIARSLIEFGANPRRRTPNNCLPLDLAMDRCDSEMMEVIVLGFSKFDTTSSLSWPESMVEDADVESEAMDSELDADGRSTRSSGSQLFTPCLDGRATAAGLGLCADSASLGGSSMSSFDCNISAYRESAADTTSAQPFPFSPETDSNEAFEFSREHAHRARPASMFELSTGWAGAPLMSLSERETLSDEEDGGGYSSEHHAPDDFVFQAPDLPPPPRSSSLKRGVRQRSSFRKRVSGMVQAAASAVSLSSASESDGTLPSSGYSSWTLPLRRARGSKPSLQSLESLVKPLTAQASVPVEEATAQASVPVEEAAAQENRFDLVRNRFPSFRRRKKPKGTLDILEQPKMMRRRSAPVISQPMGLQHLSSGIKGLHLQAGYHMSLPVTAL